MTTLNKILDNAKLLGIDVQVFNSDIFDINIFRFYFTFFFIAFFDSQNPEFLKWEYIPIYGNIFIYLRIAAPCRQKQIKTHQK